MWEWIEVHGQALGMALLALMVTIEVLVRSLEGLADVLKLFAKLTKTPKDDKALEGAAKWLHKAAEAIAAFTVWLRPISLLGRAKR